MYEYACPDCGFQFERMQKFEDKPLKVCPNCKKRNTHRVISRVAVSFKGGGFYVNDSRSNNPVSTGETNTPENKSEGKTETPTTAPATETATETKTDAKPEAKAETKPEAKADGKAEKPKTESKK